MRWQVAVAAPGGGARSGRVAVGQSSDEVAPAVLHVERAAAAAVRQLGAPVRACRAVVGEREE